MCGYAVLGQEPARVTNRKVVPVDGPRSCRSQLVVVYLALHCRHCPAKTQTSLLKKLSFIFAVRCYASNSVCIVIAGCLYTYSRTALAIFSQNLFAAEVGVSPVMAALGPLLILGRNTVLVCS